MNKDDSKLYKTFLLAIAYNFNTNTALAFPELMANKVKILFEKMKNKKSRKRNVLCCASQSTQMYLLFSLLAI